jgi:hypothetical protein
MTNTFLNSYKNVISVNWDEWDNIDNTEKESAVEKVEQVYHFDFDPLAYTLAAIAANKSLGEIHTMLVGNSNVFLSPSTYGDVEHKTLIEESANYLEASEQIQRYFKNRQLMRRLKNQYLSDYMISLENLLENIRQVKQSQVAILVKLPDFYREGKETDQLFNQYQSVEGSPGQTFVDDEFMYISKIERYSNKDNTIRYYFVNQKQELLKMEFKTYDRANNLVDYIVRQNKPVRITGYSIVKHQPGYDDFLIYIDGDFKFDEPNS